MGIFSLFFSSIKGTAHVDAFEPNPKTFDVLNHNLALNQAASIVSHRIAFSNKDGKLGFTITPNSHTAHLTDSQEASSTETTQNILVDATTLDAFYQKLGVNHAPDFIKMDIEGAGAFALRACDWCIEKKRPWLFIESHSPNEDAAIGELALHHNYVAYDTIRKAWITDLKATHPNPNGVSGRPLLVPAELKALLQTILH